MKKLLILILGIIISNVSISQNQINPLPESYPQYYVVNGDTIGAIFTIEQMQKIDNDLELLSLLEKKGINCDSLIKSYIVVIDDYGKQVAILESTNASLEKISSDQKLMILNLKEQISNYKKDLELANAQLNAKDEIIVNKDKQIKHMKIKQALSIGGGFITTGIAFIIGYMIAK